MLLGLPVWIHFQSPRRSLTSACALDLVRLAARESQPATLPAHWHCQIAPPLQRQLYFQGSLEVHRDAQQQRRQQCQLCPPFAG